MKTKLAKSWGDIAVIPPDVPVIVVADSGQDKERVANWIAQARRHNFDKLWPVVLRYDAIDYSDEPKKISKTIPLRMAAIGALVVSKANVIAFGVGTREDVKKLVGRVPSLKKTVVVELAEFKTVKSNIWAKTPPYEFMREMQD